jgi:hypothetical protein
LKEKDPAATPEGLVPKASLSKREIVNSAGLRKLADDLEKLRLSLALPNAMVMDYPTYELEIHTQYGSTLRA